MENRRDESREKSLHNEDVNTIINTKQYKYTTLPKETMEENDTIKKKNRNIRNVCITLFCTKLSCIFYIE